MFISHVYRVREYSGCLQFLRMRNVTTGFDLTRPLTRFTCVRDKTRDCNFVSGVCTCLAGYKGKNCGESKLIHSLISTNTKCIYKAFDLVI